MAGSVLAVSPAGIVGKRLAEGPGSGVEPAEFEPQASLLLAVCGPQMLPTSLRLTFLFCAGLCLMDSYAAPCKVPRTRPHTK